MVFDAMNTQIGSAEEDSIADPSFIVSVGDNIYPAVSNAPTLEEWELMLGLFNRTNIADLPVWAIRGNKDANFDWTEEIQLTMEQQQWSLPSLYYKQLIPSGKNGELMGLLYIDSVLMACSDYTASWLNTLNVTDVQHQNIKRLRQSVCADPGQVQWGNMQYEWIV